MYRAVASGHRTQSYEWKRKNTEHSAYTITNMQFLHSAYTVTAMHRTGASGHARHEWEKEKAKGSAIFCFLPPTSLSLYICTEYACMCVWHNPMSPPPRDKRLGLDSSATNQPVLTGIGFCGIYSCWGWGVGGIIMIVALPIGISQYS